jgi:hypothetical protein
MKIWEKNSEKKTRQYKDRKRSNEIARTFGTNASKPNPKAAVSTVQTE